MKKIILLLLLTATMSGYAQSNIYLKQKWNLANIEAVKSYVSSAIGGDFKLTSEQKPVSKKSERAEFVFTNAVAHKSVKVEIRKGLLKQDTDSAPDTIIRSIMITGFYPALFNIYNKTYTPSSDINAIKQVGYDRPLSKGDNKAEIGFYKASDETGYWSLWIRG